MSGAPRGFSARIPFEALAGLRPRAWLCVGAGFSREDLKAAVLERSLGFTGDAITSLPSIALKIVSQSHADVSAAKVLGALARQEVLRLLLANSRIAARMPELKRLRRQSGFFRKLDLAMQAGRMAFAHGEEGIVYGERLQARFGQNQTREELQTLSMAYEAWLDAEKLLDPPALLRLATEILNDAGWPQALERPEVVHLFTAQTEESLERGFWDALARHTPVERTGPLHQPAQGVAPATPWEWELWHTLDDAAEELADRLAKHEAATGYRDCVVLIPDTSSARRSLRRALESRGVPLADPRDPTRLRWEEGLKWATLPLSVAARAFERDEVISYLRAYFPVAELPLWVSEIQSRGIRLGLNSYSGGKLLPVHVRLMELSLAFGGKRTCAGLGTEFVAFLREHLGKEPERQWILPFFEKLWAEFTLDMERVGLGTRKAPPLYWWERLSPRLAESQPPVERFKPEHGVGVYRLHQAPLKPSSHVYVLGLPPQWLSGEGVGDYWFSERERETLSGEFAVRSALTVRQERLAALQSWVAQAERVCFLDAGYDVDGRERETIDSLLRELASSLKLPGETVPEAAQERGAHPRWIRSYGAQRPVPPLEIQLPTLATLLGVPGGAPPEITATAIDSYSRCGFQALAYHRWRLRDMRDPDTELWPEARGNILHAAVKILLESRDAEGGFAVSNRDALDQAWVKENPRGLLRSPRAEQYVRSRMLIVLDTFREKEREYFARAPSRIASLDSTRFKLSFDDVAIVGTPDRIDEHPEGIFVLDYKTSSSLPNGTDMVELGYRLQLPFYALAASGSFHKPVLGLQFVELNRKGSRGSGIFFKKFNGKEAGKLTTLTARSKSLLAIEPEDAWEALRKQLHEQARKYVQGEFKARPKKEKECSTCMVADFCGFRRLTERPGEAGEGRSE